MCCNFCDFYVQLVTLSFSFFFFSVPHFISFLFFLLNLLFHISGPFNYVQYENKSKQFAHKPQGYIFSVILIRTCNKDK